MRTVVDDNLQASLGKLGYAQSFTLTDLKLALGYMTIAIAGGLFYLDKKFEFKDAYNFTVAGIVVYFIISGIHLFFTSGKFKNNKYVGYNDSKEKILISSWTNKYEPTYHYKIVINDDESRAITSQFPFTSVFDSFGYYKSDLTTEILQKELEKFGKKDL